MGQNLILNMNDHGSPWSLTTAPSKRSMNSWQGSQRHQGHRRAFHRGNGQQAQAAAAGDDAGEGRQAGGRIHRATHPAPRTGRHHHRRRQQPLQDTIRRVKYVESKGLLYIGTGVSGGEEGARHGPSIMPGGSPEAWPHVKDIFQSIAAKVPRRHALLRLGRRGRRRPLREDGAQRHRVRRHAAHLRGLPAHARRPRHDTPTKCTRSSPNGTRASSIAT
jgi:hypothetical protein